MAGCDCRKDIFKISYDTLTTEVASQHKDWTSTQVRQETARLFRPSFRQNMESVKRELGNEKVYPGADFIFEDGKVNFVDGLGTTNILTFHERQRRDTPEEYSPEQHQTSLLIQTAFQNGANEVVTSYPEKNGQRDIVVMKLDRKTGKGTSYIINTAPDGNDHSIPEIQQIAKSRFESLAETKMTDAVFVLSDTRSLEQPTKRMSETPAERTYSSLHRVVQEVPRTALTAAKNTAGEVAYTVKSVNSFFQKRQDNVEANAPQHPHVDRMLQAVDRHPHYTEAHKKTRAVPLHSENQKITFIEVASTKSLAEKNVIRVVDKSIRRHDRKLRKNAVRSESRIKVLAREKSSLERKRKNSKPVRLETRTATRRNNTVTERRISLKKRIKEIARVERVARKVGRKRIMERVVRLLAIATRFHRGKERRAIARRHAGEKLLTQQEKTTQRIKESIFSFSISLLLWVLLNGSSGKTVGKEQVGVKKNEGSILSEHTPTPWVLFAIIWQLAMIREGGMRTVRAQVQTKKTKRKSYYPSIAPQGVIFAYVS